MTGDAPRGIAVVDVGATNTKIALFGADGQARAERKAPSRHVDGPPYRRIDPEPVFELLRKELPELDRILPVDVVVPCAHGAALACLKEDGSLALPIMDYLAQPPARVVARYQEIAPPFSEVFAALLPMALTHGLQLFWQQQEHAKAFEQVATILSLIQYATYRLCGAKASEISALSSQSHLISVRDNDFSSLAKRFGWERLFPPIRSAWEAAGELLPEYKGASFRGRGRVLIGVHDSNANYLRYLCAGFRRFTLLSTGTWVIGFAPSTPIDSLEMERDTATNTDVFGRPVASCRFFGGREFECVAEGASGDIATIADSERLIGQGTMALPSFTDSGGPLPGTGGKGRIIGPLPTTPEAKASLASLYCAQMVAESLDAVGSRDDIVVDGPFARNMTFMRLLAAMRPEQRVKVSDMRDGTTAGAACLALFAGDRLPHVDLSLMEAEPAKVAQLERYRLQWREEVSGLRLR